MNWRDSKRDGSGVASVGAGGIRGAQSNPLTGEGDHNLKEGAKMKRGPANRKRMLGGSVALPLLMAVMLLMSSGCSVYMAAKQPRAKDLSVLKEGTPRSHVIAELGAPAWSGEKGGNKVDVFAFTQGYSAGAKAGRAFFHGAADVFTLGLWEVIGTPVESVASGTEMKVEVIYDGNDQVKAAEVIEPKGGKPVGDEASPVKKE